MRKTVVVESKTFKRVIQAFLDGKSARARHTRTDGRTLYVYDNFEVATKDEKDTILIRCVAGYRREHLLIKRRLKLLGLNLQTRVKVVPIPANHNPQWQRGYGLGYRRGVVIQGHPVYSRKNKLITPGEWVPVYTKGNYPILI